MTLLSLREILTKKFRSIYSIFAIILNLILFIYIFNLIYIDNIKLPRNQILIIINQINQAFQYYNTEEIQFYLDGLIYTSSYESSWISKIDDSSQVLYVSKKNVHNSISVVDTPTNFKPIYISEKGKWYLSFSNHNFHFVNYNFIGSIYKGKLYLTSEVDLVKYISIFLFSNLILLLFVLISSYLNIYSIKYVTKSFKNFVKYCELKNMSILFENNFQHPCLETAQIQNNLVEIYSEMLKLNKSNAELEVTSRFSSQTIIIAHDVEKIVNNLMWMKKRVFDDNNIENCRKHIENFGLKIEETAKKIKSMLEDISFLSKNVEVIKNKHNFHQDIFIQIVDKYKFNERCKFIYNSDKNSYVYVFKDDFERVLNNLIINAFEAIKDGIEFEIIFELSNNENYTELKVRNTKSFIAENDLEKIFDIYFTKGKRNGTGLGLASVKKIISDHSGCISCLSSEEEKYVEFVINIPNVKE